MNPAYSVIVFTTASGAGFGWLLWLAVLQWTHRAGPPQLEIIGIAGALALASAGLLSSTFHLGHPERAWRAFSQWRSSWLSREGVAAVAVYPLALGWMAAVWAGHPLADLLAAATALAALVTVGCTAMIYASLKPIPRWHNPWVLPAYLAFAVATGGLLQAALASVAGFEAPPAETVAGALVAAWLIKFGHWRSARGAAPVATAAAAIGLPDQAPVRQFAAPHTQDNYVLREMGFRVARKHAGKLRRIALAAALAAVSLVLAGPTASPGLAPVWALAAVAAGAVSVLIERWLFFAEAWHVVTVYYGHAAV